MYCIRLDPLRASVRVWLCETRSTRAEAILCVQLSMRAVRVRSRASVAYALIEGTSGCTIHVHVHC